MKRLSIGDITAKVSAESKPGMSDAEVLAAQKAVQARLEKECVSGSPAVNEKGELVGLLFDGNIQSLGNDVVYTEEEARSVCVHPAAMIAALRQVYGAGDLADELEKPSRAQAHVEKKPSGKKKGS